MVPSTVDYRDLYAINPENGSVKWVYDVPGTVEGGTPCSSIDGTIYLGTWEGGYLIAVNPDGTERWKKSIGSTDSPPAIGADGTVYIGSDGDGYMHSGKDHFGSKQMVPIADMPILHPVLWHHLRWYSPV